jgi:hypothetical protein
MFHLNSFAAFFDTKYIKKCQLQIQSHFKTAVATVIGPDVHERDVGIVSVSEDLQVWFSCINTTALESAG